MRDKVGPRELCIVRGLEQSRLEAFTLIVRFFSQPSNFNQRIRNRNKEDLIINFNFEVFV